MTFSPFAHTNSLSLLLYSDNRRRALGVHNKCALSRGKKFRSQFVDLLPDLDHANVCSPFALCDFISRFCIHGPCLNAYNIIVCLYIYVCNGVVIREMLVVVQNTFRPCGFCYACRRTRASY